MRECSSLLPLDLVCHDNRRMKDCKPILIAGGGLGGLATALACTRGGWSVEVVERAAAFGEVGAGIQIGPNVTRRLQAWGLETALNQVAAFPDTLCVRSAQDGAPLGQRPRRVSDHGCHCHACLKP